MAKEAPTHERTIYVHYTATELADKGKTDAEVFHKLAKRERHIFGAVFKGTTCKNNISHQWKCLRYPKG